MIVVDDQITTNGSHEGALSENPVISVMVGWMYNNTKDVKTAIDNTLRVSAPLCPCVKLKNNNEKDEKDAMAQRTKVSGCISLEFLIVPCNPLRPFYGKTHLQSF